MKILLVGEYSRLHNSLKEGLVTLGHDVTIIGSGDDFKKFPVDIRIYRKYMTGFAKKWKMLWYTLTGIDLTSVNVKQQFYSHAEALKGHDVVQLINESPFGIVAKAEKELISFLASHNARLFLLSCGTDHISVSYAMAKKFRYSIFLPLFQGKVSRKSFQPSLKYMEPDFALLHAFIFDKIDGVIASDLDYHIPLKGHPKYLGLIPNPINTTTLSARPTPINGQITIFHGINRKNYYKKGSDYFEEALQIVSEKYPKRVKVLVVESLPYAEYITSYESAHIVLDQVLGYDQGYNALEAMAKGKVVFTGAEKEFEEHYKLENQVAINALPDANAIAASLCNLIENPEMIREIGANARAFVEREHDYISVAKKYEAIWEQA